MALTATSFMNENGQIQPKKTGLNYLPSGAIPRLNAQFQQDAVNAYESQSYNNGGFLGGLGYLGEKVAVGFMSSIEGIWDYAAGGLAKLFGADDWAEQQFANDWFGDWYSHPEEWFNPSGGWQTAGDIAGGIGTSLPAIASVVAAAAITYFSGGTLSPVAAGLIGAGVAGFGAAGTATKQAYKETGQLTGKEFGYGALTGFTEGALEGVTTALSMGTGQVINSVAKSFAKETTKTVAKQTVIKTLAKGFIGEAFEEGMAEILDPVWQRLTYNPEAQNATPQEVAYAAFVGGMSGMIMSGGNAAIDSGNSFLKGNSLVGKGLDAEVIGLSQQLSEFEGANATGDETFQTIAQTYADLAQSLATTDGKVVTVTQKKLLGDLHRANTVAVFKPMIARSAANIVNNAEVIAQRLNEYGYKTTDGTPITFTAEQIREGVDTSNPTSFSDALKNNGVLRTLAIADTTGHLVMDTARFEQATLMGKRLASQVDLNRFIETATPSEISAVSQALGIENWATLDVDTFNQKITSFVENGGVQQYADRRATVQSIQAIPAETARPMPKMVNLRQDGSVRYSDGSTQIAITRQGDAYTVYDYASGHLSKNMTRSEVNKLLRDYNTQQADITAGARAQMEAESELRRQAEELDTYARQNITDYSKLSAPNQSMIRKVIREGRAKGMSDEDVLAYAKISAHAGIDISFDKQATFRGYNEEGKEEYADGFYDPKTNRIVVNPEAKRSHERLLLHELEHTILRGKNGVKLMSTALKNIDSDTREKILRRYGEFYSKNGLGEAESAGILADEVAAHYAEEILSNRHTLERLVEAEPSLKDKILSFFKGASEDYKSVPRLSRAARSYYKTYKKLFDEFAERNFQNNATEAQTARLSGEVSDARFSLQFADHIADNQRRFVLSNNVALTQDELERAIDQTAHMVELMSRYKDILPADTVPKKTKATLVKNGSYDISVENTTICVRTLAYNSFVEMVSEKIGRPLTQMESFLVSQKLYDIAKEPQCLYCYVSLDRKAYNDMVLKYIDQRERAIEAYERAGRPDITSESHPLYQEYLAGRKATKPQWKRYTSWIEAYRNGDGFLTTQDVSTESRRAELARTGTPSQKAQLKDMTDYAQNASQAKKQTDYVAYYDDILRLSAPVVRNLNKHYGLRWYSFSDYSGAFIVENMQQITDASIRGLKGLAYTKDADFVRIFAPTGMNINVSVFVKENADGTFSIDPKQSANATVEELISLREAYPNVGVVATATSDAGVEWALAQGWTDVVIPLHIVRTGSNVADFYKWKNFTFEQSDTVADQNLWDAYVSSVAGENASARKKVSKMIYPSEHQNNRETYLRLIEERGLKPRFSSFLDNPNYMKLVNETRQSEAETVALKPVFDVDAAEAAFQKFVDKGGYYEGWYNDGIDVESEAETVAQDVLAGKKANEVSYGRQDIDAEGIQRGRKSNREHGRRFALDMDSEGTRLTEAQQEFFKDSKVRDEEGRLLVLHRGSPEDFGTVFRFLEENLNSKDQPNTFGFFFTDSHETAEYYSKARGNEGDIKTVYLNIEHPLDLTSLGISSSEKEFYRLLEENGVITGRSRYKQDYKPVWTRFDKNGESMRRSMESAGFDGVVYHDWGENKATYVAFYPEQIKSITNEAPTSDPDIRYALSETRGSIMTEVDPEYKPTVQDKVFSGWTAAQIAFTNAQAGIEAVGKKYGVRNIEALVQAARSGRNQAEEMIAGNQYRIGADTKTYQGEGLEAIFRPISRQGEEVKGDFFDYLFNYHNMSRMTLEQRSMAEQQTRLDDLKKKVSALKKLNKRIEKLQEQIKALGRSKKDMETKRGLREELAKAKAEAKTLKKEATELEKAAKAFVPLENKPVLGTTDEHGIETVVTAEQSEAIVKKYEEAHPEFKGVAEKVWAFLQNLNQYRVDTGLISQDTFDYLAKLYPHYVPTYRTGATKGIGAIEGKYNLKVKTTIKTAKGSTKNLLPPDVMIARQVMETVRAGRINQLANALYEGAQKSGDTTYIEIVSRERMSDEAIADLDPTELRPKNNEVVFFRDGERITMRVSKEIFAGFNAFNPEVEIHNPLVNGARAINNGFKRLVTSLNPAFLIRNTIRDVQDAGINTRYGKTFLKNYARATYEISHNGRLWQLYKAMGGFSSSVFDFEKGFSGMQNKWGLTKAEGNLLQQTLQGVENANAFVEQLPRLAEFISSIEAGNTAEQAILDSADVTTNFARMGNITKVLNRTLIPFLNPSIQGCSKMIRNITSIRSAREFASLALKAALVGVAPMVLNMLMYEDDEDYKNLRDADKENNFLFKVGDTFVKIPRGRVASVIGGLVNRSKTTIEGEDADWAGYVKNIMQQVTPVDSMSRTIFSPFSDVANNLTWYGSAIEGRQFENTAPRERFDENTSVIAKAISEFLYTIGIGKAMEVSPKKVHYLLDQYSGVIGDFILPATTAKAEKGFLSGNFTLDPATSNRLSTDFYEMYDQAQYAKTAGDDTAAYQVRYLNKVKSAISDMYKQKSEIQNNPDLSNAEKLQQTRVVQLLINEAYKTALQDFELYTKAIEATAGMEDENLRFTEATRLMYGAERALSEYNDDVYAKCQMLNKAGVDYEVLYSYYFTVRGITSDKDYEGNTISGSKRKKVVASIKGMNISVDQKLLLICASGYALQDNDLPRMTAVNAKKRLLRYILNLKGATQTEKTELAEMCGFEVKNGRVVTKSVFSLG